MADIKTLELTNIYILRLEGGMFYVGKTINPTKRYAEHRAGKGSAWTKKYPPIDFVKVIPNSSPFEENKQVMELMYTHGRSKVRGGLYKDVVLTTEQELSLDREEWAATDCCIKCGKNNHFSAECFSVKDIKGRPISPVEKQTTEVKNVNVTTCPPVEAPSIPETVNVSFTHSSEINVVPVLSKKHPIVKKGKYCRRCGNSGHTIHNCTIPLMKTAVPMIGEIPK
jgi:predicted GIY-YIG superfamily endonuclease